MEFSQHSAYQLLVKTSMQFIKLNKSLIEESDDILSQPVYMICQTVRIIVSRPVGNSEIAILRIQKIILHEMWKLFPDNFHGIHHLLKMIVKNRMLKENETVLKSFEDVLWCCLPLPQFYQTFFSNEYESDQEMKIFYEICIEVMDRISETVILLSTASQSSGDINFCVKLIKSLSNSPQLMEKSPETFDNVTCRIVKLMISKELATKNFQFIEKFVFQGVFKKQQDSSMNWICFTIFYKFISKLKSRKLLQIYFEILTQYQGQSSSIQSEFAMRLLKLITNLNPIFENNKDDTQNEFINDYRKFINNPSVQTHDKVVKSLVTLKSTRITSNDKEIVEAICQLIGMTQKCDWNVFSKLIIAILDVIIETRESQTKIQFLLKIIPIINSPSQMSMNVRLKVVEMLFSFVHFSMIHEGVNGVLTREFRKLLNEKNQLILMFIRSEVESNENYKEFISKIDKNLNVDQNSNHQNSKKYDEFLNFIRTLKSNEISKNDQIKINEICRILKNFQ